jgi:ABC-type antimicrobial peptide transport system permease subunit
LRHSGRSLAIVLAIVGLALVVVDARRAAHYRLPTFAAALAALAFAALVAGVVPARHALTIDPAEALRSE